MEEPTRPHQQGESDDEADLQHRDYMQRILRKLTDSQAAPFQSSPMAPVAGSSPYTCKDPFMQTPSTPGLNPWSFNVSSPDATSLLTTSSPGPNWRPTSSQYSSSIQREILTEFPWLSEELQHQRTNVLNIPRVSSAGSYPKYSDTPEEAGGSSRGFKEEPEDYDSINPLGESVATSSIQTPEAFSDHQLAWAQSMLDPQAFESPSPYGPVVGNFEPGSSPLFSEQLQFVGGSNSGTPNSESLSSSVSDGEAEHKASHATVGSGDAAGTSVESGKRKTPEREESEDAKGDEPEAKKQPKNRPRKKGGVKRVREPRYAIKTRTDVDIMDDGYKWRKYGQKAVKNSPHPRNYYRCTTPNCPVRKRVERSFEDPGLVVTTYEGTHTHQTPGFHRPPPGSYFGGFGGLFSSLGHHYTLPGTPTLPPFSTHSNFSLPSSGQFRPLQGWLPQHQPQSGPLQDDVNLLRAHQLFRLQQEAVLASIKPEPFQYRGQELMGRPQERQTNFSSTGMNVMHNSGQAGQSFSTLGSVSQGYHGTGSSHFDPHSSALEQLGSLPLEYGSFSAGPSSGQQGFLRRQEEFRGSHGSGPSQDSAAPTDEGLLEDMLRPTIPNTSRA